MSSIIKFLSALAVIGVICTGCDDIFSSGSSGGNDFLFEEQSTIQFISGPTPNESADGIIGLVQCGDVTLEVMEFTSIRRLRSSCSGYDVNDFNVLRNGDRVVYKHTGERADWANGVIRPQSIEATDQACIEKLDPCGPCNEE